METPRCDLENRGDLLALVPKNPQNAALPHDFLLVPKKERFLLDLVLNVLLFWGMELVVPGFDIAGLWPAVLGSIVLSLFSWLIEKVF